MAEVELINISKLELNKLRNDLKSRKILRDEIKKELAETLDLGDVPENFPYHAAVAKQRFNESKIHDLEWIIRHAVIINNNRDAIIRLNDSVELQKEDGSKRIVKIVPKEVFDVNPTTGMITVESPLGKEITGKKVNDAVELKLPGGLTKYTILRKL